MTRQKTQENIIYLIFWVLVFTIPVLLSPGRAGIDWIRVAHELVRIFPFFLVFLVNNFLLFRFFKEKKYVPYFMLAGFAVMAFSLVGLMDLAFYRVLGILSPGDMQARRDVLWGLNVVFYNVIFSVLVIGLNNAVRITLNWMQERGEYEKLQKENLRNQLSMLQHQVSPHFFMNTLNNIHALIDYDSEVAKKSVVKLSQLMRVLLYENAGYTLQKEIRFLEDYIDLMKIRVTDRVEIRFDYPDIVPHVGFPPLLFISLVENAFKHGILPSGRSFIHITFECDDHFLEARIRNSKNPGVPYDTRDEKIGLNNSRKRFELLYGNNHTFDIHENAEVYEIFIKIPLNENPVPGR